MMLRKIFTVAIIIVTLFTTIYIVKFSQFAEIESIIGNQGGRSESLDSRRSLRRGPGGLNRSDVSIDELLLMQKRIQELVEQVQNEESEKTLAPLEQANTVGRAQKPPPPKLPLKIREPPKPTAELPHKPHAPSLEAKLAPQSIRQRPAPPADKSVRATVTKPAASAPKADLIMGMALNTDAQHLAVFCGSLRRVSSVEVVLFMEQPLSARHAEITAKFGITVRPVGLDTVQSLDTLDGKVQKSRSLSSYHPSTTRWVLFFNYLSASDRWKHYNRVWFLDVRDTVFQADPFSFTPAPAATSGASAAALVSPSFFFAFQETLTIGECGWNGGWVRDCFGEHMYNRVSSEIILCSGASVATMDVAMLYLRLMNDIFLGAGQLRSYLIPYYVEYFSTFAPGFTGNEGKQPSAFSQGLNRRVLKAASSAKLIQAEREAQAFVAAVGEAKGLARSGGGGAGAAWAGAGYLTNMYPSCERNGVDQGVHNVLLHGGLIPNLKVFNEDSGFVTHMQSGFSTPRLVAPPNSHKVQQKQLNPAGAAGRAASIPSDSPQEHWEVYSPTGKLLVVAHQYDRNKEFALKLFQEYAYWLTAEGRRDVELRVVEEKQKAAVVVSTPPTQSLSQQSCQGYTLRQSVDLFKGECDLVSRHGESQYDCCAVCTSTPGCKSFTYVVFHQECYLKTCTSGASKVPLSNYKLDDAVSAWKTK